MLYFVDIQQYEELSSQVVANGSTSRVFKGFILILKIVYFKNELKNNYLVHFQNKKPQEVKVLTSTNRAASPQSPLSPPTTASRRQQVTSPESSPSIAATRQRRATKRKMAESEEDTLASDDDVTEPTEDDDDEDYEVAAPKRGRQTTAAR